MVLKALGVTDMTLLTKKVPSYQLGLQNQAAKGYEMVIILVFLPCSQSKNIIFIHAHKSARFNRTT